VLCAAQTATVAAPARQARPLGRSWVWLAVPAALLGAGVAIVNLVPQGPHVLSLIATFGTPVLAAAGGIFKGDPRWWLWPPSAAGLWFVAWLTSGLVRDAAGTTLIALACLAAGVAASTAQVGLKPSAQALKPDPRRLDPLQLAAFSGALMIGAQLVMTHWFYLYIPWFLPFALVAMLPQWPEPVRPRVRPVVEAEAPPVAVPA